jgi:hypothetical protein
MDAGAEYMMTDHNDVGLQSTVDDLESQVEFLTAKVEALTKTVEEIRALGEAFWRDEAAVLLVGAAIESWRYDVRNDNVLFADVYPCELFGDNGAKRWVGRRGELSATVALNRTAPLVFSAVIQDFAIDSLQSTFQLEIDGQPVPWSAIDGQIWSAKVPEHPGHARLRFRLSVEATLLPPEKDVSFSFTELQISPLSDVVPHLELSGPQ